LVNCHFAAGDAAQRTSASHPYGLAAPAFFCCLGFSLLWRQSIALLSGLTWFSSSGTALIVRVSTPFPAEYLKPGQTGLNLLLAVLD
jgi:hypothetical protein